VTHAGNQNCSPEEAHAVAHLVTALLQNGAKWIDGEGEPHLITLEDVLIITPYNAQVFEIQQLLPGARVGTVDKFQGQEAPVAIYSTATSSHADAPRGMEFLYSLNRLNVATSRARCISILVSSPQVFEAECRTPRQIQLANAFCRYLELAERLS
jgi:superfamily I DNA and/or RNA helicase